jgi:hypothetical protein
MEVWLEGKTKTIIGYEKQIKQNERMNEQMCCAVDVQ